MSGDETEYTSAIFAPTAILPPSCIAGATLPELTPEYSGVSLRMMYASEVMVSVMVFGTASTSSSSGENISYIWYAIYTMSPSARSPDKTETSHFCK